MASQRIDLNPCKQGARVTPPKPGGFIGAELKEEHLSGGGDGLLHGLMNTPQTMGAIIFQAAQVCLQRVAHIIRQ